STACSASSFTSPSASAVSSRPSTRSYCARNSSAGSDSALVRRNPISVIARESKSGSTLRTVDPKRRTITSPPIQKSRQENHLATPNAARGAPGRPPAFPPDSLTLNFAPATLQPRLRTPCATTSFQGVDGDAPRPVTHPPHPSRPQRPGSPHTTAT